MEQGIKDTLHLLVGMIDELGKKVDRLDTRVERLEEEVQGIKEEQQKMNDKFDAVISMWSDHEVFIRQLKMKKII
ncbi:hypothetical protein [Anaerosolibacter sp.]|uniref:hypothetical protein n=1 Tax=Anaerosolibacter sp. TaxID=1872527 RepID=UPI0039EED355